MQERHEEILIFGPSRNEAERERRLLYLRRRNLSWDAIGLRLAQAVPQCHTVDARSKYIDYRVPSVWYLGNTTSGDQDFIFLRTLRNANVISQLLFESRATVRCLLDEDHWPALFRVRQILAPLITT